MSSRKILVRAIKIILSKGDQGSDFNEILALVNYFRAEDDDDYMDGSDLLFAMLSGTKRGFLVERQCDGKIFVTKEGVAYAQKPRKDRAKVSEDAADDEGRSDADQKVTKRRTVILPTGFGGVEAVWDWNEDESKQVMYCTNFGEGTATDQIPDDNLEDDDEATSSAESHNSSDDNPESGEETSVANSQGLSSAAQETSARNTDIPDNDIEARRRIYLKDSVLSDNNQDRVVSSERNWQQRTSDRRESSLSGKRMPYDKLAEDATSPKKAKFTPVLVNDKWLPFNESGTEMADKMADKDEMDRFGINATDSSPNNAQYASTSTQEDDLAAIQRARSQLNIAIFRYGQRLFKSMSAELDKKAEDMTRDSNDTIPNQASAATVFQSDAEQDARLKPLHEDNGKLFAALATEACTKNTGNKNQTQPEIAKRSATDMKVTDVRKASRLRTMAVHTEQYHPSNVFFKAQHIIQRNGVNFIRNGELNNTSGWFAECENNVGHFYKDVSHLDEDDSRLDSEFVYDGREDFRDVEGCSHYDFYT